ncbi:MAG TPA: helix-turn-helix transcriptional regulator [Xanthobacteraceae bacterium]|nr:helix-turn-helix transcriptional regulator [Xanthobacteraceae bacterium]
MKDDSSTAGRRPGPSDVEFGQRLRSLRIARGMTQAGLGESMGLPCRQVRKYEKGHARLNPEHLSRLANIFQVPVSALEEPGDMPRDAAAALVETAQLLRMTKAFSRIRDSRIRDGLIYMLEQMAEAQEAPPPPDSRIID